MNRIIFRRIVVMLLPALLLSSIIFVSTERKRVAFPQETIAVQSIDDYSEEYPTTPTEWCIAYLLEQGIIEENDLCRQTDMDRVVAILNTSLSLLKSECLISYGANMRSTPLDLLTQYAALAMQTNCQWTDLDNACYAKIMRDIVALTGLEEKLFSDFLNCVAIIHKTESYIAAFDPVACEMRGADIFNARYDDSRMHKPLEEIDIEYDYDFEYLKKMSYQYAGIDRRRALSAVFHKVTKDATTETEKQLQVLAFLSKAGYHNTIVQPMYETKATVYDPLLLLELNEMRCGQVSRLAVDLYESVGYSARLAQLGGHLIAEIFYEGDWHYLDADMVEDGKCVMKEGKISSLSALSRSPLQIDSVGNRANIKEELSKSARDNMAAYYFDEEMYSTPPCFYNKTASEEESLNNSYGWNYYSTQADLQRELTKGQEVQYCPRPVAIQTITRGGGVPLQYNGTRQRTKMMM